MTSETERRARRSLTERIIAWPRATRLLLVFLGVLTLAFTLLPIVWDIYFRLSPANGSPTGPAWIVTLICLPMYFAGYMFVVGTPGRTPPAGRAQRIYLLVTGVLVVVTLVWTVIRLVSTLV